MSLRHPVNSGLGVGVVRGLHILIINLVLKYFTQQVFAYNFAGDMPSYNREA